MTTAFNQRIKTNGITVPDIVLIVLIVALSTGVVLKARLDLSWQPAAATRASIYQSGELEQVLDLKEHRQISLLNGKMVLEIMDNKIRVKQSDCPARFACGSDGSLIPARRSSACRTKQPSKSEPRKSPPSMRSFSESRHQGKARTRCPHPRKTAKFIKSRC